MNVIPTWEEIRRGDTTDIYFRRTMEVLRAAGKDRTRVVAEAIVKKFPGGYGYGILSGKDELLALLSGLPVDVDAMEEGTLFQVMEPVFTIEGPYGAFCELETAMLGVICQASGIATAASRVRRAAGDRSLLSFGARRMHPALSTLIDRNAFVGGADGVSVIRSASFLGETPQGTMPHALVLVFGDTVTAMQAFDATVDPAVPRVCLIDTLQDEKFEAVRVAEALREKLSGIRLDTPGSRRGDFRRILQEVRWELDLRGFRHVRLIASGGLGEEEVRLLRDVVDGFGVGTSLSNAPTVDYALDIVEVEDVPFAKRGKWSGRKQVHACDACGQRSVLPAGKAAAPCACGGAPEPMLLPAMRNGKALADPAPARAVRERVLRQLERFHARGGGSVSGSFRTLSWEGDALHLLDQRVLPVVESTCRCVDPTGVADAIRTMVVRGAPAIGVAAAFGLVLAVQGARKRKRSWRKAFDEAATELAGTRPTAVNLFWAIRRMRDAAASLPDDPDAAAARLEREALAILEEDVAANRAMGAHGAKLLPARAAVLTHCNAGALATAGYGTALGVVRAAVTAGKKIHVYVDETRPFLQGSRLTAWELMKDHIPCTLITDSMAASLLAAGKIDAAIVGADRVAGNGDVANKIGTYGVAVLCRAHRVPFYVAAPLSTIDPAMRTGKGIPIEERDPSEVTHLMGKRVAPHGVSVYNPVFDVTPARYVSAIVTERGVLPPPFPAAIRNLFR